MAYQDPVLVRYKNDWVTGVVLTENSHNPNTGKVEHHVQLDLPYDPVEAFDIDDVYFLKVSDYTTAVNRKIVYNAHGPMYMLRDSGYTIDQIPSELKVEFRSFEVLFGFRQFSQYTTLEYGTHLKYDPAKDSVDFINTEHVTLVIQSDQPLPCPIRRLSKKSSVLLRIKTASPSPKLPKQLPRVIAGTFSLDMKDAGTPSPSLSGWSITSANNLLLTLRGTRQLDFSLKSGAVIDSLVLTCYDWVNLKAIPPNLSIKTLMIEDINRARPFNFEGLPALVSTLAMPNDTTLNFLSLFMWKNQPHMVRGFKGASYLNPILSELRNAPKHERNRAIKQAIADLRPKFPRNAFTLRY